MNPSSSYELNKFRCRTGLSKRISNAVAMLTKLVERFDPDQYRVRENASGVARSFEDEDDDEHEDEERQKAKGRRQKLFVGPPTRLLRSAFCLLTSAFPRPQA